MRICPALVDSLVARCDYVSLFWTMWTNSNLLAVEGYSKKASAPLTSDFCLKVVCCLEQLAANLWLRKSKLKSESHLTKPRGPEREKHFGIMGTLLIKSTKTTSDCQLGTYLFKEPLSNLLSLETEHIWNQCVYSSVCMRMYVCCVCECVYACVCMWMSVCVNMWVQIHAYTHTQTCGSQRSISHCSSGANHLFYKQDFSLGSGACLLG